MKCFVCGSEDLNKLIEINKKPAVEVDYSIPAKKYLRTIYQCENCLAYNNIHDLIDDESFYSGDYNKAIDPNRLKGRFDRIIKLDASQSDNKQRVRRVIKALEETYGTRDKLVLDVGSGTCVFLYELLNQTNYTGHCIDPDPNAIDHALKYAGVAKAHCGDIFNFSANTKYDLITFNKVLEHIKNPTDVLIKAKDLLVSNGIIYIELPEGDRIAENKIIDQRAEFAVEHYTVYNENSISVMAANAGLNVHKSEVITDPSGKFTIYAFLTNNSI